LEIHNTYKTLYVYHAEDISQYEILKERKAQGLFSSTYVERKTYLRPYFTTLVKYPSTDKCESQIFHNLFSKDMGN
ncbi:hypothetical protein STEG23_008284, partial [Scotinomys teguina]